MYRLKTRSYSKNIFIGFCFLSFFIAESQIVKPKIFAGANGFYDKGFESNNYGGFEIGSEILQFHFLAPEIGLSRYSGKPNGREIANIVNGMPRYDERFESQFRTVTFTIAPKLLFGNEEAALVILPQYNTGNIKVRKNYYEANGNYYEVSEKIESVKPFSYWNFSAGVEGDFFNLERFTFSLLLNYATLNSKKAIADLPFSETDRNYAGGSKGGIGLTFRAYFHIFEN